MMPSALTYFCYPRLHGGKCSSVESNEISIAVVTLQRPRILSLIFLIINFLYYVCPSTGFTYIPIIQSRRIVVHSVDRNWFQNKIQHAPFASLKLSVYNNNNNKFHDDKDDASSDNELMRDLSSRVEEIQVDTMRHRLEHANVMDFVKRKPKKLPYEDARRWIQANLGPNTKEEFYDLVENGNLRTPYIPKRPEEYYSSTREWISWEHFLTGIFDNEQPSAVKPSTGIFD